MLLMIHHNHKMSAGSEGVQYVSRMWESVLRIFNLHNSTWGDVKKSRRMNKTKLLLHKNHLKMHSEISGRLHCCRFHVIEIINEITIRLVSHSFALGQSPLS